MDDSGVHQLAGGVGKVDRDASLVGYDCSSSVTEAEACSPGDDDFSLTWGKAWGSCGDEEGY